MPRTNCRCMARKTSSVGRNTSEHAARIARRVEQLVGDTGNDAMHPEDAQRADDERQHQGLVGVQPAERIHLHQPKQEALAGELELGKAIAGQRAEEKGRRQDDQGLDGRVLEAHRDCAVSDGVAFGTMEAVKERGKKIPEDVALAGIDDVAESMHTTPPLATVHVPRALMGSEAVRWLVTMLRGESGHPTKTVMYTHLVVRGSCGGTPGARVEQA